MNVIAWGGFLPTVLAALAGVAALLTITWLVGRAQQRHQVIDAAWGLGFVVVAVAAYLVSGRELGTDDTRRLVLLLLTAIWGTRLAAYLAWRMRGGEEDPRYVKILEGRGAGRDTYAIKRVYLPQAVVLLLVSGVLILGMLATTPTWWLTWVGVAVWCVGMFFETVGDWQLARHKADPARRGTILDTGVWAWTRHPNYFGDATVWWGLWLVTASAGWLPALLTVLSPLLMTWALTSRTGKPLTESRMMERPGYRDYVERTSGFFPLPPRRRA